MAKSKKPTVIEHEPSPRGGEEPVIQAVSEDALPGGMGEPEPGLGPNEDGEWCAFGPTSLAILPHTPFEAWAEIWERVQAVDASSPWWIGDTLSFASAMYPETWTQVLGRHGIENHKNKMWLASLVPPAERVEGVSWSHHREVAKLEPEKRKEWLQRSLEKDWTVKELIEALRADRERALLVERRNAPPEEQIERPSPIEAPPAQQEAKSVTAEETALPIEMARCPQCNSTDLRLDEDDEEQPYLVCGSCGWDNRPEPEPVIATPPPRVAQPEELPPARSTADSMRAAIDILRHVGPGAALSQEIPADAQTEWAKCARQLVDLPLILSQLRVEKALSWIPAEWVVHNMEASSATFGGRKWKIELRRGRTNKAYADGSWWPGVVLEAAFSARLSDDPALASAAD